MGERREDQPGWAETWATLVVLAALTAAIVIVNQRHDRRLTALEAAQNGEQK